ncbi:MAG: hypothetical protein FD123_1246 [Bacteroidetes bacterium]|nr:MAG: hypothetical protein FD123_1246 [Bacteroidota bacterium]
MKPSAELFDLIKSLSKSEKGYFRKYCSIHGPAEQSNYVRMFDAIDKQPVYDEKSLVKKFGKSNLAVHWHVYKNYLHRMILRSLNRYYEDKYINSQVMELLQHVEILFDKALYAQCAKTLAKAKKIATRYEKFYLLTEIFAWEIRLVARQPNSPEQETEMARLFLEKKATIARMKNSDDYLLDHHRVFFVQRKWSAAEHEIAHDIELCQEILTPGKYGSVTFTSSFLARFTFYITLMRYYMIRNRYDIAYRYQKELLNLFLAEPHMIEEHATAYYSIVFNNNFAKHFIEEYGDESEKVFMGYRRLLRNLPRVINSTHFQVLIFMVDIEYGLLRLEDKKDWNKATQIAAQFEDGLRRFKTKLTMERAMIPVYLLAVMLFRAKKYREALHWLNKIIHVDAEQYISVRAAARMLFLLVHYELKNYELLDSLIRSTRRALERKEMLTGPKQLVLQYLKKLALCFDKAGRQILLEALHKELTEMTTDKETYRQLEHFDYFEWLDAKMARTREKETALQKNR